MCRILYLWGCRRRFWNLTVNLSKTKIVVFEAQRSDCDPFFFNDRVVERVEEYRYLGFVFHAIQNMAHGTEHLVSAAKKAVHAMRRRCIYLHLSDPAIICRLFDILVLPTLSYSCAVWDVDPKIGEKAELLHRQFLKQLLGVRNSSTSQIVLAELGHFPVQLHFWQQILRYHNRAVKLALHDEFYLRQGNVYVVAELTGNWRSAVRRFTDTNGQGSLRQQDISVNVEREKA